MLVLERREPLEHVQGQTRHRFVDAHRREDSNARPGSAVAVVTARRRRIPSPGAVAGGRRRTEGRRAAPPGEARAARPERTVRRNGAGPGSGARGRRAAVARGEASRPAAPTRHRPRRTAHGTARRARRRREVREVRDGGGGPGARRRRRPAAPRPIRGRGRRRLPARSSIGAWPTGAECVRRSCAQTSSAIARHRATGARSRPRARNSSWR